MIIQKSKVEWEMVEIMLNHELRKLSISSEKVKTKPGRPKEKKEKNKNQMTLDDFILH